MTNIWTPVQPGDYGALSVYNGGKTLEMPEETCDLPANLRLCERVEDNRPRADWSQAPDWANFWAVDACGEAHWYDGNPLVFMTLRWGFYEGNKYNRSYAGYVVLPLGIDWRLLKEQRP